MSAARCKRSCTAFGRVARHCIEGSACRASERRCGDCEARKGSIASTKRRGSTSRRTGGCRSGPVFTDRLTVHALPNSALMTIPGFHWSRSPTKDKRKQRPEIRLLALRFSVKAKLNQILGSQAQLRETGSCHSRHLRRKAACVWADHLHACHFAQIGTVRRGRSFRTSQTQRKIKQHRLCQCIGVRGHMKAQRYGKIWGTILPTAERDTGVLLHLGTKAKTERTGTAGPVSPSFPEVCRLNRLRLRFSCGNPDFTVSRAERTQLPAWGSSPRFADARFPDCSPNTHRTRSNSKRAFSVWDRPHRSAQRGQRSRHLC